VICLSYVLLFIGDAVGRLRAWAAFVYGSRVKIMVRDRNRNSIVRMVR